MCINVTPAVFHIQLRKVLLTPLFIWRRRILSVCLKHVGNVLTGHCAWAVAVAASLYGTHLAARSTIWPTLNINIFIPVVGRDKKERMLSWTISSQPKRPNRRSLTGLRKKSLQATSELGSLRCVMHLIAVVRQGMAMRIGTDSYRHLHDCYVISKLQQKSHMS